MSSEPKLTRRERENIIFQYLKGKPDPLYEVEETCHGKYVVKQKQIQLEEEEEKEKQDKPSKQQLKRERRRQNRRAKADAYKILEQLNRLLNTQDEPNDESSDDEHIRNVHVENDEALPDEKEYRAPSLINQPNLNNNPGPLSFKRKRLRF